MWRNIISISWAVCILLLVGTDCVHAMGGIANHVEAEQSGLSEQTLIANHKGQGPSKFALGPHLEPKAFHHDNPFNITEEEALKLGLKLIPVEDDHWDALINSSGFDNPTTGNINTLKLGRRDDDDDDDDEPGAPDPTDWCTPNKNTTQCTFGTWCHSMSNRKKPNRAWVFYNDCELTGELHPFSWTEWHDIYSGLPWVTVFSVSAMSRPTLRYAGREWDNWANGWELYYPYSPMNGICYYRRYFDCS
ncbi:hypothetical protein CPLU01_00057 [Colletotrichum plurivorum]|uniref:Uncharacterized protein n=1 Tax=Colletotrichum plurivorum TaxID=2175906 RepID=A0A8H6U608_9PEZI|nr:hypothetical protein CPLU01_00057 [Colletotrichum plurivorum]